MSVEIKLFGLLRLDLGKSSFPVELEDNTTLQDLLLSLAKDYPQISNRLFDDNGEFRPGVIILVNGQNWLHLQGLKTKIKDGDTICLFPPGAGG